MAKIQGVSGMSADEVAFELNRGAKFVVYRYCISLLVITMLRSTDIYLVPAGQSRAVKGMPWTLLTLVMGWWGIPWGPIRSVQSLWTNLKGGVDVTAEVANGMKLTGVKWDVASAG
jgi:hypothetical protein